MAGVTTPHAWVSSPDMADIILVTGGQGQVGQELSRFQWPEDVDVRLPGRDALDLTDRDGIEHYVAQLAPAAIVNCAAYTAVDRAEDEPDVAWAVNARGVGWLARAARLADIPMVHVSTDYVFSAVYCDLRSEDYPVGPAGVYGASKLAGEIAAAAGCDRLVIVRTAWVVSPFRTNFVKTMLRLAADRDELGVVVDQRGCPTGAGDIADALATIVLRMIADPAAPTGIYNFVNAGEASWAELAEAVMDEAERHGMKRARIKPIPTSDFPTRAVRPADSRLDIRRIAEDYDISPRHWRAMITSTVAELADFQRQG